MKIRKIALLAILASTMIEAKNDEYTMIIPFESAKIAEKQLGWLEFFHSKNTLNNTSILSEWRAKGDSALVNNMGLDNSTIPKGPIDTTSIGTLSMTSNSLSNVDFMINVSHLKTLDLTDNPLLSNINGLKNIKTADSVVLKNTSVSDLSPLSGLTSAKNLDFSNTKISSLNGLQNLRDIGGLILLSKYDNLKDISSLKNMNSTNIPGGLGYIIFPGSRYPLIDINTPFCQGLKSRKIRAYKGADVGGRILMNIIDHEHLCTI